MMVSSKKTKGNFGGNMPHFSNQVNLPGLYRNLNKADLGGVIFGCKNDTKEECLFKQLFGLPAGHMAYVKNIGPGLPLFLFNYSDRKLLGIYEAASSGQLNLDPYAWTKGGSVRTQFSAQVLIQVRLSCQPLSEDQFGPIIQGNYYRSGHFWFELDHAQASRLISCFSSRVAPAVPRALPKPRQISQIYLPVNVPRTSEAGEANKPSKLELNSDHLNSTGNSGGPDSSVLQDGDYQSSESSLRSENDEKEMVYKKLVKLAMKLDSSQDTREGETTNENETIMVDDASKMEEVVKDEDVIVTPVSQLIKELKELKAYNKECASKMNLMQQKLINLEAENEYLKRHCEMLQSYSVNSDQSDFHSAFDEIELLNEQLLGSDVVFLFGGYDGTFLSTAESYSFSRDIVRSLRPMPSARAHASVAKLNENFYVVGGGHEIWSNTVEAYNPFNNEWTSQPTLKEGNGSLATATVDNKVFAMGGGNGITCFSNMQMLDPDVGRWICGRSMLQKRFALGAVTLNNVIYAVGGYDGENYLRSAERFDPREHAWSNIESMNSKRGCHSLVVLNEKIYALGGYDGSNIVSSVEVFDPRLNKWILEGSMNHARGYGSAVALKDAIYVMGGVDDDSLLDSIERYEEGKGWQVTNLKGIGKRCYASAIVL